MSNSLLQVPMVSKPARSYELSLLSTVALVCVRPRRTLVELIYASPWTWSLPLGLALLVCYARLFTLAFLSASISTWLLPAGVAAILLGWPLRTLVLYAISKPLGGRPDFVQLFTLSAWATLPLTLRGTVQVGYMLVVGKLVAYPGLSGLLAGSDFSGGQHAPIWMIQIGRDMLGKIDVYTLWYLILLVLSVSLGARVSALRAGLIVGIYSLLLLTIGAGVALT